MLMVNEGLVAVKGSKLDVMAEFTTLVNNLHEECGFTKEDLQLCLDTAMLTSDEIKKLLTDIIDKWLKDLLK